MEKVKKQGMESLFIPYDLALELKELGFNEGVLAQYRVDGYLCWGKDDCSLGSDISDEDYKNNCFPEFGCRAALWQQAFRFFREKYGLHYIICKNIQMDGYGYREVILIPYMEENENTIFKTYEEAELECLVKLIGIVKKQNIK